jgi:hypothetical protein
MYCVLQACCLVRGGCDSSAALQAALRQLLLAVPQLLQLLLALALVRRCARASTSTR